MLDSDRTEPYPHDTDYREPDAGVPDRSLTDDLAALIEDGQTYLQAELGYQKTRVSFMANRGKSGALFILGALVLLNSALIALVLGLVLALAPLVGPLGATAIVVGALVIGAVALATLAKRRFRAIKRAFDEGKP